MINFFRRFYWQIFGDKLQLYYALRDVEIKLDTLHHDINYLNSVIIEAGREHQGRINIDEIDTLGDK